MSTDPHQERLDDAARHLARYMQGEERFVRMATEVFGRQLGETQKRILRAVAQNRRVLIVSGNGVGKSYAVALLLLTFLYSNPDSIALLTSGTYSLLEDTTWKPMKNLHREAKEEVGLPGRTLDNPPKLETGMGEEWYFKAISPTNPGSLEGRHSSDILVVIEEADKKEITEDHFESAGSSITDANDRMVAVANPPQDESNVVYEKWHNDDRWEVVNFSSFESHNAQVDAGAIDADPIPGLVDLPTIAEDYEAWNDEQWPNVPDDWPGAAEMIDAIEAGRLDRAKVVDQLRAGVPIARQKTDGLSTQWYRRRLGVTPPDDSQKPRPWTVETVREAEGRWADAEPPVHRQAIGADVARKGGDRTAVTELRGRVLEVTKTVAGLDHVQNQSVIQERIDATGLDGPVAVDAVGEGSGIPDHLRRDNPDLRIKRFLAGATATAEESYRYARDESLQMLGELLEEVAIRPGSDLAEELKTHARYCTYEEQILKDKTVYRATPKDDLKERMGKSPDLTDSAALCAWAHGGFGKQNHTAGVWGSEY